MDDILKRNRVGEVKAEQNNADDLRTFLKTGIVEFEYYKVYKRKKGEVYDPSKHGPVRNAIGTYDIDRVIDAGFKFAGGECIPKEQAGAETYWDLESKAWRVYYPSNFIRIVKLIAPSELEDILAKRAAARAAAKAKGYSAKDTIDTPDTTVEA